jgi:hypothetical protein
LEIELDTVYAGHAALKVKIDAGTATTNEKATWKRLQIYVQYQAAVFLLPGLQNLTAQKVTDGDAEMQRFQRDSLQETIDRILGQRDKYLGLVNPALVPDGAAFAVLSLVTPARDPVVDA